MSMREVSYQMIMVSIRFSESEEIFSDDSFRIGDVELYAMNGKMKARLSAISQQILPEIR